MVSGRKRSGVDGKAGLADSDAGVCTRKGWRHAEKQAGEWKAMPGDKKGGRESPKMEGEERLGQKQR